MPNMAHKMDETFGKIIFAAVLAWDVHNINILFEQELVWIQMGYWQSVIRTVASTLGFYCCLEFFSLCLKTLLGFWPFPLLSPGEAFIYNTGALWMPLEFYISLNVPLLPPGQANPESNFVWWPGSLKACICFLIWLLSLSPGDSNLTVIPGSKCLVLNMMPFPTA